MDQIDNTEKRSISESDSRNSSNVSNNDVEMTNAENVPNSNNEITEANIGHLIELFQAIEHKQSKKKSSDDDVNGIEFRCHQYVKRYTDYHKLITSAYMFQNDYVAGLIHLLRESFLSHQWNDSLKIVHILVNEYDKIGDVLWKSGMMSLMIKKKTIALGLYTRQLCRITTSPIEVLFDYLLFLLTVGDLARAEDLSRDLEVIKETRNVNFLPVKTLFHAYLGLIDYLFWRRKIVDQWDTDDIEDEDYISARLSQHYSCESIGSKMRARKALDYMSFIIGVPGVWDIFIVKMVEIHEYYKDLEAAKSLLENYKAQNPDNLNAHRYLYEFEMKHERKTDIDLDSLQNIIRLDPSNPLALELYKVLVSSDPKAVSILFDYLDFDHCKNDLQAWKLLNKYLKDVMDKKGSIAAVTKCWRSRKDWWPSWCLQTEDDSFEKLTKIKRKVHGRLQKYILL